LRPRVVSLRNRTVPRMMSDCSHLCMIIDIGPE
jgi:hypothetical protein